MSQASPNLLSTTSSNSEKRFRRFLDDGSLPMVFAVATEVLLVLILIVSPTLALIAALSAIVGMALARFPEWPIALFLTGNVLVMVLFDNLRPHLPAPTAFAFAFLAMGSIWITFLSKPLPSKIELGPMFRISAALALVLLFALTYSPRPSAGMRKIAFYLLFNMSLIALPVLVLSSLDQIHRILTAALLLGVLLALYSLNIAVHIPGYIRLSPSDSVNPIWLARSLGYSSIAAIYVFARGRNIFSKLAATFSLFLFLYLIGRTASRAPLFGLFAILLLWVLLFPGLSYKKKVSISAAIAVGALVFVIYSAGQVTHRLTVPVAQETSTAFRLIGWYYAAQLFASSPFLGVGTGGFFLPLPYLPLRYAHNFFLELASETGIVGLSVGLLFVWVTLKYGVRLYRCSKRQSSPHTTLLALATLSILLYAFWNSLFSGDISSNEIVWLGAGLVWALWRLLNTEGDKKSETI